MTKALSLASIVELFSYNYWARDSQLAACTRLTDEQFVRALGSSFVSVRDTFVHMILTEELWLDRWRERSQCLASLPPSLRSVTEISEKWRDVEREMRGYLGTISEETLGKLVTYVTPKGDMFTYELWRLMFHLLNHQSYHRGQVTTLLRQMGIVPPTVDFLPGYRMDFNFR